MLSAVLNDRSKSSHILGFILLLMAIAALVGGGIIYIAFCDTSLRMFGWYESLGLMDMVETLRYTCRNMHPSDFVLYNFPDLLWITAYLLFVNALIPISQRKTYLFWILLMPLLASGHEAMQALGVANGKFDIIDLSCYIVPLTINLIYFLYEKNL